MTGARGFTLLELIVVLLVFSIMSILAYGGLRSVLDTRVGVEAAMDRNAEWQRAYRRLRDDIRQMSGRGIRDGFGDRAPAFQAVREADVTLIHAGWPNPLRQSRPAVQRVRYRLTEGALIRDAWQVLDPAQDTAPVELTLLRDIERVQWRFRDSAREWQDEWRGDNGEVPTQLELTLDSDDWGQIVWRFNPGISVTASRMMQAAGEVLPAGSDPQATPTPGPDADATPDANADGAAVPEGATP
jgi:general secretion pathway protein J